MNNDEILKIKNLVSEFLVMRDRDVTGSVWQWIKEHVAKLQDGELFLCVGHKGLDSARELFWHKLKSEYDCGSNLANDELMEIAISNGSRIKVSDKFEECHYGAQDGFGGAE